MPVAARVERPHTAAINVRLIAAATLLEVKTLQSRHPVKGHRQRFQGRSGESAVASGD
jgi:hypothetical protein